MTDRRTFLASIAALAAIATPAQNPPSPGPFDPPKRSTTAEPVSTAPGGALLWASTDVGLSDISNAGTIYENRLVYRAEVCVTPGEWYGVLRSKGIADMYAHE